MINDEEFNVIAHKYFEKIRRIARGITVCSEAYIPEEVEEINETLKRIIEIRTIQRKQRGEDRKDV